MSGIPAICVIATALVPVPAPSTVQIQASVITMTRTATTTKRSRRSAASRTVVLERVNAGSSCPDPPTTYLQTPNICYQSDKVVVVHGKALVSGYLFGRDGVYAGF